MKKQFVIGKTLGKPYEQQPGRQHGKGTGHIVETVQEKLTDFNTPNKQEKLLQQLGDYINRDKFEGKLSNLKIYLTRKQAKHTLGYYRRSTGEIFITPRIFNHDNNKEELVTILIHEMCHKANRELTPAGYPMFHRPAPHGREWQQWMLKCGLEPNRCSSVGDEHLMTDEEKMHKQDVFQGEMKLPDTKPGTWAKFYHKRQWIIGKIISRGGVRVRVDISTGGSWRVPADKLYAVKNSELVVEQKKW